MRRRTPTLSGKWFFHEKGNRAIYCERIALSETERTCREAGARTVFEKKIQDEDAWTDQAAADRDAALAQLKFVSDAMLTQPITEHLRKQLNRQ